MRKIAALLAVAILCAGCRHAAQPAKGTVVFLIENSPTNLDPRIGIDEKSQHIDELIFDGLVTRDDHFQFGPGLAERWESPDPLTWIFHALPRLVTTSTFIFAVVSASAITSPSCLAV